MLKKDIKELTSIKINFDSSKTSLFRDINLKGTFVKLEDYGYLLYGVFLGYIEGDKIRKYHIILTEGTERYFLEKLQETLLENSTWDTVGNSKENSLHFDYRHVSPSRIPSKVSKTFKEDAKELRKELYENSEKEKERQSEKNKQEYLMKNIYPKIPKQLEFKITSVNKEDVPKGFKFYERMEDDFGTLRESKQVTSMSKEEKSMYIVKYYINNNSVSKKYRKGMQALIKQKEFNKQLNALKLNILFDLTDDFTGLNLRCEVNVKLLKIESEEVINSEIDKINEFLVSYGFK